MSCDVGPLSSGNIGDTVVEVENTNGENYKSGYRAENYNEISCTAWQGEAVEVGKDDQRK
jgi:hypothetical protein